MNAIVHESHIALSPRNWLQRMAIALRAALAGPPDQAIVPLAFADADEVLRKARAERAAYLRQVIS